MMKTMMRIRAASCDTKSILMPTFILLVVGFSGGVKKSLAHSKLQMLRMYFESIKAKVKIRRKLPDSFKLKGNDKKSETMPAI